MTKVSTNKKPKKLEILFGLDFSVLTQQIKLAINLHYRVKMNYCFLIECRHFHLFQQTFLKL